MSHDNRIKLELAFEKWDRKLQYGVSFKLLDLILFDMGLFADEKEREKFIHESGYFREANQYCCSVSLQKFFDILQSHERVYKKNNPDSSSLSFVDRFIETGENHLDEVAEWEYDHQRMRKENARMTSLTKDDKTLEIIRITDKDPTKTIEQIDNELRERGMSLSIIEKIYLLMSQRDKLSLQIDDLTGKSKQ